MRLEELGELLSTSQVRDRLIAEMKDRGWVEGGKAKESLSQKAVLAYLERGLVVEVGRSPVKLPGYKHEVFGWMVLRADLEWYIKEVWVHRSRGNWDRTGQRRQLKPKVWSERVEGESSSGSGKGKGGTGASTLGAKRAFRKWRELSGEQVGCAIEGGRVLCWVEGLEGEKWVASRAVKGEDAGGGEGAMGYWFVRMGE